MITISIVASAVYNYSVIINRSSITSSVVY
nr:MAG TPA: hypothetical protein [Caudoviricetes sp.]